MAQPLDPMALYQGYQAADTQNALRQQTMRESSQMHPLQIQQLQMNMLAKRRAMDDEDRQRGAMMEFQRTGNLNALAAADPKVAMDINRMQMQERMGQQRINALANRPQRGPAPQRAPAGYRFKEDGSLEPIPGGPAEIGKALPGSAVKELASAGTNIEDTRRLSGTFKPDFGGKTLLGDFSNTYKRVMGDETGQAQWWQDMDALQNRVRHELFGSALTATELAAWNKTSITPRMDADQIQQNLTRRQEIEARAASKLARAYQAGGYNKEQIRELLGTGAQYLEGSAPPAAGVGKPSPAPAGGASGGWDDTKESRYQELLRKRNATQ